MSRHHAPEPTSPISFFVNVARLPQKGMPVKIIATGEQRQALANVHALLEVKALDIDLVVAPWKRNGVRVSGTIEADIVQECIATLEPLHNRISEEIEQLYLPQESKLGRLGFEGGGEILLDAEGDDGPEIFSGDLIDVGALAEEYFGLAIDPYPRATGAEVLPAEGDEDESPPTGLLGEKLAALLRKK